MSPTSVNPMWLVFRDTTSDNPSETSCARPLTNAPAGDPLFGSGSINLHQFMIYVSACCGILTIISCVFLSWCHLHRYTSPQEQRQILRIINLPVFYSVFNFLGLTFTVDYMYIEPIGQIYEAFTVAALSLLILDWVAPDGIDREDYFDKLEMRDRRGRSQPGGSLRWFQRTWSAVLAYPVLKTILIAVEIVTQYFGVYCENSFSFKHAHLYRTLIDYFFVGGALGATIRFYRRLHNDIAPVHKARAKLFSFLGILIFQMIQDLIFHILNGKLFHPSKKATYNDINFGIASFLTCVEAVVFSLIFHWTFSPGEYKEGQRMDRLGMGAAPRTKTFCAVMDALNLADIIAGAIVAFQLLFRRVQSRYGGVTAPVSKDSTGLEPLSRPYGRNMPGTEEDTETYYSRGYAAPPAPPMVRDPSPGASYGRPQAHRADELRPGLSRQDSYQRRSYARGHSPQHEPLQQTRDMIG